MNRLWSKMVSNSGFTAEITHILRGGQLPISSYMNKPNTCLITRMGSSVTKIFTKNEKLKKNEKNQSFFLKTPNFWKKYEFSLKSKTQKYRFFIREKQRIKFRKFLKKKFSKKKISKKKILIFF